MKENHLTFSNAAETYQDLSELLRYLNISSIAHPSSDSQKSEFLLSANKFGQSVSRQLESIVNSNAKATGFIILRPIGVDILNDVVDKAKNVHYQIYILAHVLYDYRKVLAQLLSLGVPKNKIILILGRQQICTNELAAFEQVRLSEHNTKASLPKFEGSTLPYAFMHFLIFFLSPRPQNLSLGYVTYGHRIIDLFYFFSYVVRMCAFITFYRFRHLLLMIFYSFRHLLLMIFYRARHFLIFSSRKLWHYLWNFALYPVRKVFWFTHYQYRKRMRGELE